MAATRHSAPFQIYQDMTAASHGLSKPRPQLQPSAMPLQPSRQTSMYQHVTIQPPLTATHSMSPVKGQHVSPNRPHYAQAGYMPIPALANGDTYTDSPVKGNLMQPPQHFPAVPPPPPQSMFGSFDSNMESFAHNGYHVTLGSQNESVEFPAPQFARRPTLKRSLSDAAPLGERPVKRVRVEDDASYIPDPRDMPPVEDDGGKPGYSYAQMIGMAILRAPSRQLTLAQIYEWISTTFKYYRDDPKQGWHNSIRHNLSLNKSFKKKERPKGDAGKGSYWTIEPGMEAQFIREKTRKSNIAGMTVHANQAIHVMAQPLAEALTPSWSVPLQPPVAVPPPRPQTAPALPELSSDATLPASDPALDEEEATDLPSDQPQSSPAPLLGSSPPVVVRSHNRTISSPIHGRGPSTRIHKRSATAFDDSGYFTDLTSSVRRPKATILPSEIDMAPGKQKRGRAEEEINRIRSSPHPHATPSSRRWSMLPGALNQSSSPSRPSPSMRLNPATPAVHFKKPYRPPPSVSPHTQLMMHRQQMMCEFDNSPLKKVDVFQHSLPDFSPQYKETSSFLDDAFIVHDDLFLTPRTGSTASPFKSIKRPNMFRANTSAGILGDVTNTLKLNAKTPSKVPALKPTSRLHTSIGGSPLKKSTVLVHDDEDTENIFGPQDFEDFDENTFVDFPEEESTLVHEENELSSETGVGHFDLSKGFANIGHSHSHDFGTSSKHPFQKPSRPVLGLRSNTSVF